MSETQQADSPTVKIFDTTLRDGSQGEGISFTVQDKLKILKALDEFKIDYVEGGWPGSNPKDIGFFVEAKKLDLKHAKLCAFGSTCRAGTEPADDANIQALLEVDTPAVSIFGKSWDLHVTEVFRTTLEENLRMIESSVAYLKSQGREVIYDAEHFFDGYKADPEYALTTLEAAYRGGAACLVLCDTNGGTLTHEVGELVDIVRERIPGADIGIHTHNDGGVAVSNSLEAIRRGANHVQGTINGLGERCGNADLIPVIASLNLKMGRTTSVDDDALKNLTHMARFVGAVANQHFSENQAYVGRMAFAHKGGVHVNSVMKVARSYEHINPELVGNSRRILVSELSGKSNMQYLATTEGIDPGENQEALKDAVKEIKSLENLGFVYEGSEASSTLIVLRHLGKLPEYFKLVTYRSIVDHRASGGTLSEATVKIAVQGEEYLCVGEGVGPVDAMDEALRGAIDKFYPEVRGIRLSDYKVRVIDTDHATDAKVRVTIETIDTDTGDTWGTVGANENIIEASWLALRDSITYGLLKKRGELS